MPNNLALKALLTHATAEYRVSRDGEMGTQLIISGKTFPIGSDLPNSGKLSQTQRKVADFYLSNFEECAFLSASKIAERSGVSESSVVRFATTCGFSGFPAFQRMIQHLVRERLSISKRLLKAVSDSEDTSAVLANVIETDIANLHQTLELISPDQFENAVSLMSAAKRIYVVGLRTSAALATILAMALRFIGRESIELTLGIGDYWEKLNFIGPDDILVAITFRSYTKATQEIIHHVYEKNIPIIMITDSAFAPGTDIANTNLIVQRDSNSIVESSTTPVSLINALAVGVAKADEKQAVENLRANETLWQQKGIHEVKESHKWKE